jgi:hypothetical protein
MKMYRDEPTLLHPKEFVILANYYYLHEQCQEVDTWNRLKWYEYYENPYAAIQSHPLKMVTWKFPNQYCNGSEGDWKNVQKLWVHQYWYRIAILCWYNFDPLWDYRSTVLVLS